MARKSYKGRGATLNPAGRFEQRIAILEENEFESGARSLETITISENAKTVINQNSSPDIPFNLSINPYRGCEHGCVYCFARPTHSYWGFSPGLDFETKIICKENAAEKLKEELSSPRYRCQWIAMGANTDPYQPIEREKKITRSVLQVMQEFNQPVGIVTKSALITRDIDILAEMANKGLAEVIMSITTLSNELKTRLEPRASTGQARLDTLRKLTDAGIPTGILFAPVIPFINDSEIEDILAAAKKAGAQQATMIFLRLPYELKEIFSDWLQTHYPEKAQHVLSLIAQSRQGKLNNSAFKQRMKGEGPYAELLYQRFKLACRKNELNLQPRGQYLRTDLFSPPAKKIQLSLF